MKIKNIFRTMAGLFLSLTLAVSCFAVPAFAYSTIDTGAQATLNIQYPCAGASFRLYQVADVSAYREYTLTPAFAQYPISLEQADQTGWRALAQTLSGYTARDQIAPVQSGTTDAAGTLSFSGLPVGLYLLVGDKCESDGKIYTSDPLLIALPTLDAADNWVYNVTAKPKYDVEEPDIPTVDLKVVKIWKDADSKDRPDHIEIQLLRDGAVWASVTLNADNNWQFTWEKLDGRFTWQIVEKNVPDGYTVTVQAENGFVTVTNTKKTPDKPQDPDKPDTPDDPKTPDTPKTPDDPKKPHLPQTGVLWWPVGVLAASGIAFLLVGCIRKKHTHE